jgi:hypothetical protein
MTTVAFAVEASDNRKVGIASVTYASQASCSDGCRLKPKDGELNGCYANVSRMALHTVRVNSSPITEAAIIAETEAAAIRKLSGRLDLRVHAVGDCKTPEDAEIVSTAMAEHEAKHGNTAWTYTHSWQDVPRTAWHINAVLASCHSGAEVRDAQLRGYAAAIVIPHKHPLGKRYVYDGVDVVPCPYQTRGIQCVDCRLCLHPQAIGNAAIGFEPDKGTDKRVRRATLDN